VADSNTNSVAELRAAIDTKSIGSNVEVIFLRNGQQQKTSVILEEMPSQQ
jgi:S1-C subfamily serine protease